MMSTSKAVDLNYLKELKELDLSPNEAQEALQSAVTLVETSVKEKDIASAKEAYSHAQYWGDDKENKELFKEMGDAIIKAEASIGDEVKKLTTAAGQSYGAKQWKKAQEIFQKILAFNPKDNAIIKRLKDVELKLNPPKKAKPKKVNAGLITVTSIAKDVSKVVDKLTVVINREQKEGKSVARLVRSKMILARMVKKVLVE